MFDRLCLRANTTYANADPGHLDLGLLAEAMLFYETVDVVMNRQVLRQLLNVLGPDVLLRLAESETVNLAYCNQFTGVLTDDRGTKNEKHFLAVAEMPHTRLDQQATELFQEATGKSGKGRRLANRFLGMVSELSLPDDDIHASATADTANDAYLQQVTLAALSYRVPTFQPPSTLEFHCVPAAEDRLQVETNIDWASASQSRRLSDPSASDIGAADVLSDVVNVWEELSIAAHFRSELATNPIASTLIRLKCEELFLASTSSAVSRQRFQDLVVSDAHAVREAVNSGRRSFEDAMELASNAERFRSWLACREPDADLVREYLRACTAKSWADRLPAKSLRWLLVTVGGSVAGAFLAPPVGAIAGPVLGTVDALQDAFLSGWRPNQFVEKQLEPFVDDKQRG
jgi:hypothetical protein